MHVRGNFEVPKCVRCGLSMGGLALLAVAVLEDNAFISLELA
jgi:hypothetical protein